MKRRCDHPRINGRCQTCDNARRQQRQARLYNDGLTPAERLERAKRRWTHLDQQEAS